MSVPPSQVNVSDQATIFSAFISYAAKADKDAAFAIAGHLEALGLKCWIAPRNVRPGKQYAGEIVRGIATSRCFILVLSRAANGSKFVRREVEQADRKDKPVYTIRIEEVDPSEELQLFLSEIHWIDAFQGKLATHAAELAQMLRDEEERFGRPKGEAPVEDPAPKPRPKSTEPPPGKVTVPRAVPSPTLGEALQARWWVFALRGALALAVGLGYAFSAAGYFHYLSFINLIGAYLLADAGLCVALGIGRGDGRWRYLFLLEGLVSLAVGAAILWWNDLAWFPMLAALWALGTGTVRAVAAWRLDYRDGKLWLGIAAGASLALGLVLLGLPLPSENADQWIAGWLATGLLAIGPAFLALGFQLDRLKLAAAPPARVSAIDAAGAALAPYWWAFAARGLIAALAGGAFLAGIDASALPETVTDGQTSAWVVGLGLFLVAYGVPGLVPGFGASSEVKLWRVFIAESAVLIAAGLFALFNGGATFGFVALAYYGAMLISGGLLLVAACGLGPAFGRAWLALAALATLIFPLCNAAKQFTEASSPFRGRPIVFLGWLEVLALVLGALLIGFAITLRARARAASRAYSGGPKVESTNRAQPSALRSSSFLSAFLPGAERSAAQSAVLARNWRLIAVRGGLAIAIGLFWVLADNGYFSVPGELFVQLYTGALLIFLLLDGGIAIASGWRGALPQARFVPLILSGAAELLVAGWVALQRFGMVRVPAESAPWPPAAFWMDVGIGLMVANVILLAAAPGLKLRYGLLWLVAAALTFIAAAWFIMLTANSPEYAWIGDALMSVGGTFFLVLAFQLWSRARERTERS